VDEVKTEIVGIKKFQKDEHLPVAESPFRKKQGGLSQLVLKEIKQKEEEEEQNDKFNELDSHLKKLKVLLL
jgi:hypothetical protein